MQLIDPHHHLWDPPSGNYPWLSSHDPKESLIGDESLLRKPYLIDDFMADFGECEVVKSVHVQCGYDSARPVDETRWLQSVADSEPARGFPHGIVAFGDFSSDAIDSILKAHCQFPNVRGIRQILNFHSDPRLTYNDVDFLLDPVWRKNFALLEKYELSFDLQVYYQQMDESASLAREYPGVTIILNHAGMPAERDEDSLDGWRTGMRNLASCPNVSAKISGLAMCGVKS